MLGLAALHLTMNVSAKTEREALIRTAEYHQSQAIILFTPTLTNMKPSTYDAAFSLSLILVIFSFGLPLIVDSPYESNSVDEIHQVLALVKSMMDFSVGIYENVRNGEVGRLTVLEESAFELSESSLSALSALYEQTKEAQRANATHEYEPFRETIQRLEVPLGNLDHDGGLPSIFIWIFLCPTPFFDLISQRDPLALIVLAHYCVALHQHRSI